MECIKSNTYKMKNHYVKTLKEFGFYYNREISDSENKYYSIRFPVLKYNKYTSVVGEINVNSADGKIIINVYDPKGKPYVPFYNNEYGNFNDILSIINKNIIRYLKKYKIKKVYGY